SVQWNNTNGNGTVQVSSYGCSPEPANRIGSLNVSITAPVYITISGRVTSPSGQGISTVLVGSSVTNSNGDYSFTVQSPYSGTIIPSHSDYFFSPNGYTYNNVVTNQTNQNYIGTCAPENINITMEILWLHYLNITISGLNHFTTYTVEFFNASGHLLSSDSFNTMDRCDYIFFEQFDIVFIQVASVCIKRNGTVIQCQTR
ncbi:carboxypeptidase-like regulatory domain-containing protein, partial [Thermoflexibacter ruber]